jgi:nitroimidazol reductase NimA-like FMN-containing flavoprotein (pyridoxamine 5'-phosphate oxidase superfamily)
MTERFTHEDVTVYTLDDSAEERLLREQNECVFIWANKEGWPVGVVMSYVFREGSFWLTASGQRRRIAAVRRDPRVSIAVSSKGTSIAHAQTVTYKGRCTVHDDEATKAWFYPALVDVIRAGESEAYKQHYVEVLDSPRRVILQVEPTTRIGFDGSKMHRATVESFTQRTAAD